VGFHLAEVGFAIGGEEVKLDISRDAKDLALGIFEDEALGAGESGAGELLDDAADEILQPIAEPARET